MARVKGKVAVKRKVAMEHYDWKADDLVAVDDIRYDEPLIHETANRLLSGLTQDQRTELYRAMENLKSLGAFETVLAFNDCAMVLVHEVNEWRETVEAQDIALAGQKSLMNLKDKELRDLYKERDKLLERLEVLERGKRKPRRIRRVVRKLD